MANLKQLPPHDEKLRYCDYGIVDGGGFAGKPGKGYALPEHDDPRIQSSVEKGREIFELTVSELADEVRRCIGKAK